MKGFDLATKHKWHAEDVSWPLKKSGIIINGKTVAVDFAPRAELAEMAA